MKPLICAVVLLLAAPYPCLANSFTQETSMVFKLNNPSLQLSSENTRFAFNRASASGTGSGGGSGLTVNGTYYDKYQYQNAQPMNNVIQVTENYEIILNGDNNTVSTTGAVLNVEQQSEGSTQDTGNALTAITAE
jgi:hypothetical protein